MGASSTFHQSQTPARCLDRSISRRDFVASAGTLGALWLAASPGERLAAAEHAHRQMQSPQPALAFFAREQAVEIEAIASRILPTTDTPGAREAGVVYFIDRALATWGKEQRPVFAEGLRKVAEEVARRFPGESRFSVLSEARQDEVLRGIEETPFFGSMRFATIAGMFALPLHGGNRDFAGWALIGQDRVLDFKPPFSWYDEPGNRRALLGDPGRPGEREP